MMSYTINDIELSDYGFEPRQASGSNLALSGAWDMPDRLGKVFHDWGEEEGVVPYLEASEIRWSGRDLVLHGFILGSSEDDAHAKAYRLKKMLGNPTVLLSLSCDWGDWEVQHIQSPFKYLDDGKIKMEVHFREPAVPAAAVYNTVYYQGFDESLEGEFRSADGIDGVTFNSLGLTVLRFDDYLTSSGIKDGAFRSYDTEGYQLKSPKEQEITLHGAIKEADFAAFKSTLNTLHSLFSAPKLRYLTKGDQALGSFFSEKGFKVKNIQVSDSSVSALITIPLVYDGEIWPILIDEAGNRIVDELGNSIWYGSTDSPFWLDEEGEPIVDEAGDEIIYET